MTRSVTAAPTRATSIDIDRAYRQLQRLRKLVAQAESADKVAADCKPYERQETFVVDQRDNQQRKI